MPARRSKASSRAQYCGAHLATTLGAATLSYLPYAVFDVTRPLLAIAAAGSRMPRRKVGTSLTLAAPVPHALGSAGVLN
jgi:Na+/H+ antiporter NhaC